MSEQNIISAVAASNGTNYLLADATKSAVSVDMVKTDVNLQHISQEDYERLVEESATVSNWVYFVSSEYEDAYGQQIKNMAPGTDLSDAVNLEQLTEVSSRAYDTYTQSEVDQKIASAQYFKKYVVQTLPPVADADVRGIYLVPSSDPETQNTYDEYVIVGEGSSKAWEKIGTKSIDLSGYKTKQNALSSPTASDSATAFIDTVSQNENGVITATKKNVQAASTSLAGIVQLNNTLTSTATNQAATANAVKTLNDTKLGNTGAQMIAADSAQSTPGTLGIQADSSNLLMLEVSAMTLVRPGSGLVPVRFYKLELPEENGTLATKEDIPDVSSFSSVSVDNQHADVNLLHISQADYEQLVVDDEVLSNALYIVSSDYVETYGQQIKNVADPTDLSDAVNKEYVDSNFQPVGNYLTAVPDAYKTYAATLSSLSSTYSLTSHTHTSYVPTSRTVAGQQLTANVTAATISSAIGLSNYMPATGISKATDVEVEIKSTNSNGDAWIDIVGGNGAHSLAVFGGSAGAAIWVDDTYEQTFQSKDGVIALTSDIPTKTSQLTNDSNFLSAHQSLAGYVPTSRTVAGQQLTANVTAATISSAIGLSNYSLTSHTHSNYSLTSHNHSGVYAPATHAHGNIQSGGTLQTTDITIASGDKLVVTDSSDSSKVARTSLAFDGSTTTQFLSKKGTFETALTAHQSLDSCLKNTGSQTVYSCHRLTLRSDAMDSSVVPESPVQSPGIGLQDKNAYAVGYILCDRHTSGRQSLIMRARQTIDGVNSYADIGVAVDADNTKYAYCPTPPSSSNSTCIATTEWVRSRMSGDYVSKAALKTALASVGQIPSGDDANLENTIAKFNALFAALSALTD